MQTALTADWLYSFFTSHPIFVTNYKNFFYCFTYFWPSGFKTITTVNHCKQSITNQEPPAYEYVCVCVCIVMSFLKLLYKTNASSETYKFNNVS